MTPQLTILLLAFVAANLPWFSDKVFYILKLKSNHKNLAWCLLELLLLYLMIGAVSHYAEYVVYGQIAKQAWEFYAVTFSLFLVFAFPGFIYKILWKKH
jgi:Na+(H+)/acetate symporter ActP